MNNVKIYGADQSKFGSDRDAVECFWRNLFAQAAAVRFHRPPAGIGLSEAAMSHIRSARMFLKEFDIYNGMPRQELLLNMDADQVYCFVNSRQATVLFCGKGSVELDVSVWSDSFLTLRWLHTDKSTWQVKQDISSDDPIRLHNPFEGIHVALLCKKR